MTGEQRTAENLHLRERLLSASIAVIACACFISACSPPSPAVSGSELDQGMAAYKAKDYNGAIAHFSKSIEQGNKTPAVYLFSGFAFSNSGQTLRAYQTYQIVTTSFPGTPEAKTAADLMQKLRPQLGKAVAAPTAAVPRTAGVAPVAGQAPAAPGATGLMGRIIVTPPLFSHAAVSKASIQAAEQAIAALPKPLRARLDASEARVILSPNLIDRWPDSVKDLPEQDEAPTLAELPGRIYGQDMCVYERAKVRGSTALKEARQPAFIRLQVGNMCFQVLDGDAMTISKDPGLREAWESDKSSVPPSMEAKLATFMKNDDWGPRETGSELFGSMMGGRDENTDNLYRYFPRTKKWLIAKMGIAGQ